MTEVSSILKQNLYKLINNTSKDFIFLRITFIIMIRYLSIIFVLFLFACNNTENDYNSQPATTGIPAPKPLTFTIDKVYPHDTTAFTEGLEFYKGNIYESTGLEEKSSLKIVDLKTGKTTKKYFYNDKTIFGEGITIFKNKIYQLTWKNNKVFVFDVNNISKPVATITWNKEGWGMTHDDRHLILSDGSPIIYYVDPENFRVLKTLSVSDNTGSLDMINELEFIDGFIYSNRWQTDDILKIDTANGHVVGKMNFKGILEQYASKEITSETNYLNGIAYDSATKKLFITGKNWPKLFEIRIN
ncbi:glutaminyl-peptide cyclotransferase [soil metagenome]